MTGPQAARKRLQEAGYVFRWLRPCPFRDDHARCREWVARYGPQPADETATALTDENYSEQMVAYGQEQRACTQPLWEQVYVRAGADEG